MKRKAISIILSLLLLLLVSCTFSFDGSTAIQEVFAYNLYDEGVYLDKGGMTLIIKQDKSVTPLDYYILTISRLNSDSTTTIKIEYEDNFDIIEELDIERGIYTFQVVGYKDDTEVSSGIEEDYTLENNDSTLTISLFAVKHTHEIVWLNDATYHWKGCRYCSYTEPDTKEFHQFTEPDSTEFYYCTVCGRGSDSSVDVVSPGSFGITFKSLSPKGHIEGTKNGDKWTFTYVEENADYSSTKFYWEVSGEEQLSHESSMTVTIPRNTQVQVLCIFTNGYGYGSDEATLYGSYEKWPVENKN